MTPPDSTAPEFPGSDTVPPATCASPVAQVAGNPSARCNTGSHGAVFPAAGTPGSGRATSPGGGALDADGALSPGSRAIAAAMSEDRGPDSLDAHVRRLIKDLKLWGFHVEKSLDVDKQRTNVSGRGWPDWVIFGTAILYRELKSETGTLRPDQEKVRDTILAAGGNWALWRPSDLLSGRIAAELAAISGLRVKAGAA